MKTAQHFKLTCLLVAALLLGLVSVAQPVIITQPTNQMVGNGGNAIFSVAVSGPGPLSYQWQLNGTNLPNNIISTVAGTNGAGFSGDGGAATNAKLNAPYGVAVDALGNIYIADASNCRIREVPPNGIITTVAGTNTSGFSGDGGSATNAMLKNPWSVAVDASGDLFIADTLNNRIREVAPNGIISTVAGTNGAGFSGDGGSATNAQLKSPYDAAVGASGNLFIADTSNNRIREVAPNGVITTMTGTNASGFAGDGGSATIAKLSSPHGLAVDASGNLFIADTSNNRIRKVDNTGLITTVAGNGNGAYAGDGGPAASASLSGPAGVALDAAGNLLIADSNNNRVRKVLLYAGYPIFTVSDAGVLNMGNYSVVISNSFGSVTSAVAILTVAAPPIVTFQPASQIAVMGSSSLLSVSVAGAGPFGYLWFLGGTNLIQSGTNNTLALPSVATNNAGNYLVIITNSYGSVTSQVATLTIVFPPTLAAQPVSQTALSKTNVIFSVTAGGTGPFTYQWQFNGTNFPNNLITTVAGNGTNAYAGDGGPAINASLYFPEGVGFDSAGNLYIADHLNNRVRKVDTNGIITTVAGNGTNAFSGDGGFATNASLALPANMAWDAAGDLFIVDQVNNRVRRVDTNSVITTVAGGGSGGTGGAATNASFNSPYGVALDVAGNLYVADQYNNRICKVDTNGMITTIAAGTLSYPGGVALDAARNLYVADWLGGRIRKLSTSGSVATLVPGVSPLGLTMDPAGNLFIGDFGNNRVCKVDTNGIMTTVAGNGIQAYAGDGGAATNASLCEPQGVAMDAAGNLFIGDWGNHRIREVHFAGFPTLTLTNLSLANAGNYSVVVTSPYGSVTSSVVSLTVIVPPTIQISNQTNGQFSFTWNAVSNRTYQLQYTTNLGSPVWTGLGSTVTATNSLGSAADAAASDTIRFYRLLVWP